MIIRLTPEQRALAISTGEQRYNAPELYRSDRHGARRNVAIDILGAAGELAVSIAHDLPWETRLLKADFARPDFAPDIQVRTAAGSGKCLILHPSDQDEHKFVFVSLKARVFHIYEWIWGWEGKHEPFWRDPIGGRPAYFVPIAYIDRGWDMRQSLK